MIGIERYTFRKGVPISETIGNQLSTLPLEGVRVIDASTILAGPMCCQILGDFGADVIKIENPRSGDNMRGHGYAVDGVPLWWKEVARNKRTIAIDLHTSDGAELLTRLAATADVLVENFRPGTLERWGIGPDKLREINPGLIVLRITGFGQTGPYSSRPGFGTLAEAMSGFAHLTGPADRPPSLPSFGLADSICAIAGSSAVTMALRYREVLGGKGQDIDMSILEPMMAAVGPAPSVYRHLGIIESRHGNRSTHNSPRNAYETKDGSWVAVSASALRIAERVMELVGHPEVAREPWFRSGRGRVENADLIDGYLSEWISQRSRSEVLEAFEAAEAAIAPVYDSRDLVNDKHVLETQMLVEVDDPDLGKVLMHNVMWRMSESPGEIKWAGKSMGADTDEILTSELGLSDERISELRDLGVIA